MRAAAAAAAAPHGSLVRTPIGKGFCRFTKARNVESLLSGEVVPAVTPLPPLHYHLSLSSSFRIHTSSLRFSPPSCPSCTSSHPCSAPPSSAAASEARPAHVDSAASPPVCSRTLQLSCRHFARATFTDFPLFVSHFISVASATSRFIFKGFPAD